MIDQGNLIDSPAGYSKSDYDRSLSSEEWRSEVTAHDRSRKLDKTSWNAVQQVCPYHGDALLDGDAQSVRYEEMIHDGSGQLDSANSQQEADSETFVMGSDAAEFLNKGKYQVRKRQKIMWNVADSREEHTIIWRMFMAATMNAATFMGKNFLDKSKFHQEFHRSHLEENVRHLRGANKKRFTMWIKFIGKNHSWKQLSLIGDETVIHLQRAKIYVFSESVLCLGKVHQHLESNEAWKRRIGWIIIDKGYRDYDGINGEPTELEWNIFP